MIAALEDVAFSFSARDRPGAMTADIGKGAQLLIRAARNDNRLLANPSRQVLSRRTHLFGTPNQLPGARENLGLLLVQHAWIQDRKSTRLNSSHDQISYAVFCLKKKKK